MHPDVLLVEKPDGTSWLLHMSANACRFDAESTQLLKSIVEVGPERSILDLSEQFDADAEEVRADVFEFISDLQKQKIIRPRKAEPPTAKEKRRSVAGGLIKAALSVADRFARNSRRRAWTTLLVARWAVAQFGWATTIKAWEQHYPQPPAANGADHSARRDEIDRVVRETAANSLLHHECKERALACLAMARGDGIKADLVIGLTYVPLNAHVWVECGERIISDKPEHCGGYDRVARYGGKDSITTQ